MNSADYPNEGLSLAVSQLRNNWVIKRIKEFFFYKDSPKEVSVLDIGCGRGHLANQLAVENFQVTGIDKSAESIELAQQKNFQGKITFVRGDIHTLPFEDETFDAVTCLEILEHVDDPKKVLSEIQRVLKPNGFFFFHCFSKTFVAKLVMVNFARWFFREKKTQYIFNHFINIKMLKTWMDQIGLRRIESHGIRPRFFQFALIKSLFLRRIQPDFEFTWGFSQSISYCGVARKVVCSLATTHEPALNIKVKTK